MLFELFVYFSETYRDVIVTKFALTAFYTAPIHIPFALTIGTGDFFLTFALVGRNTGLPDEVPSVTQRGPVRRY